MPIISVLRELSCLFYFFFLFFLLFNIEVDNCLEKEISGNSLCSYEKRFDISSPFIKFFFNFI
jgi:hypothetical protein